MVLQRKKNLSRSGIKTDKPEEEKSASLERRVEALEKAVELLQTRRDG
ncbi:hypothetical protein [Papillibacter cinnamivorans]|uniref:Uncharacterized protein n=1 Tax=Papillibacter cinnamivorans DSM 12816 TaxID=1122930 RepID=A0A1W2C5R7_9FIRM|nr:hypothetical protein [Papillibacter cinnamivorans]SMC80456.1 hypothetical protein SAMN02745168_2573 [Papillibacter cinnamivorans DSM 12816]